MDCLEVVECVNWTMVVQGLEMVVWPIQVYELRNSDSWCLGVARTTFSMLSDHFYDGGLNVHDEFLNLIVTPLCSCCPNHLYVMSGSSEHQSHWEIH